MSELTIQEFQSLCKRDMFREIELEKDKYRIELNNSWLICMVFIPEGATNDVDILYLSSFYQSHIEQKKLMAYAGFVIGQRVNNGVTFSKIEFEQPMQ